MLTPQLLALLQQSGNAIKPPPFNPALINNGNVYTGMGMSDDQDDESGEGIDADGEDNDDDDDDEDSKVTLAANAGGSPLPGVPPTGGATPAVAPSTQTPSSQPAAGGGNPINLATAASGGNNTTPAEKKGIWSTFLTHMRDNPDLVNSLFQFAAGVDQGPKLGQNQLSVITQALANASGGYRQSKSDEASAQADAADKDADRAIKQQLANTEQQKANTQQQTADWDKQAGQARLVIESGKAKSDEDLQKAHTAYFTAETNALGQNTSDSGAKQQMAGQMADAAVATGMFKDKNKAFLWAADSVLHTQGQTPAQLQQSMIKEATDQVMKTNPDYKPEDLVSAVKGAQTAYQYMVDNHLVEGAPQPSASNAPVTPAPAPGGVVAAAATPAASAASAAPAQPQQAPPPAQRVTGTTYMTPKGLMKWMGNGWLPAS